MQPLKPLVTILGAVAIALLLGGAVLGQPTPGVGVFSSVRVNNVGIISANGKIPAHTSAYFDDMNGSAITFPFTAIAYAAGNFTASGAMTWTVDSGDVLSNYYRLDASTVLWTIGLTQATIGGVASTELRIANPAGILPTYPSAGSCVAADNTGTAPAMFVSQAGLAYTSIFRDVLASNWAVVGTNNAYMRCVIMLLR